MVTGNLRFPLDNTYHGCPRNKYPLSLCDVLYYNVFMFIELEE